MNKIYWLPEQKRSRIVWQIDLSISIKYIYLLYVSYMDIFTCLDVVQVFFETFGNHIWRVSMFEKSNIVSSHVPRGSVKWIYKLIKMSNSTFWLEKLFISIYDPMFVLSALKGYVQYIRAVNLCKQRNKTSLDVHAHL
jgi:hypothetical protein